ncbi:MAG: SRPBCC family protein, partial [Bdellovibrionia bacterium]
LQFDQHGHCTYDPVTRKPRSVMRVEKYVAMDKNQVIWLKWGEGNYPEPTYFSNLKDYQGIWIKVPSEAGFRLNVENQLDISHVAYVHAASFAPQALPVIEKGARIQLERDRILWHFEDPKFYWELVFPNVWSNPLQEHYLMTLIYAPVDDTHTELYIGSHRKFLDFPVAKQITDEFISQMYQKITEEDQKVVRSQQRALLSASQSKREFLVREDDRTIRHFRKWLACKWPFQCKLATYPALAPEIEPELQLGLGSGPSIQATETQEEAQPVDLLQEVNEDINEELNEETSEESGRDPRTGGAS